MKGLTNVKYKKKWAYKIENLIRVRKKGYEKHKIKGNRSPLLFLLSAALQMKTYFDLCISNLTHPGEGLKLFFEKQSCKSLSKNRSNTFFNIPQKNENSKGRVMV